MADAFATVRRGWIPRDSENIATGSDRYNVRWHLSSSVEADNGKKDDGFSMKKWKNKRHLMMKDVYILMEKRDNRAPHKAQEVVLRMQKLSKIHQNERLLPNADVYNVSYVHADYNCDVIRGPFKPITLTLCFPINRPDSYGSMQLRNARPNKGILASRQRQC